MPIYNSTHTGIEFDTSINNILNAINDGGIASKNYISANYPTISYVDSTFPTKTGGVRAARGELI